MLTQDYIREKGIDKLVEEYSIRTCYHPSLPLVILNYDQLESPKTDPIVRECRSLVLEVGTWNLVARAFPRFFNWGEVCDEMDKFDWTKCKATSKEDGSLGVLYYYDGWRFNTRGSFGDGTIGFHGITWEELFCKAIGKQLDELTLPKYTYVFELTSIYNKVVRLYEEPAVYLLTMFDGENEISFDSHYNTLYNEINFNLPEEHTFSSAEQVKHNLLERSESDPTFEGYVLYDGNQRWKIKSKTYVALHHMRGNDNLFNPKYQIPFILAGEVDEAIGYFPECKESILKNRKIIDNALDTLLKLWYDTYTIEEQSEFGKRVGKEKFSGLLFRLRREGGGEKELKEYWKESNELIYKTLFKEKK